MTSSQTFDESDRYKIRLMKISDEVICPLLRQTLTWVTPDWDQKIGFLTYLENKNVDTKKLKKKLYPEQLVRLKEDNPEVTKWDVSLIHLALRYCGGLADKDDIAWSSKSGKEPECLITALKDVRNVIAHETFKQNQESIFDKTEELRTLMEKALSSVGKICSHVSKTDIDTEVTNVNKKLNEIRDADIAPKTLDEYEKELFFSDQIALIKDKGVPFLKDVLCRNTTISPLSLIEKGYERQVPVDEIFTEIQLDEDGKKEEVLLEDLIDVASGTDAGSFILLKGHAGMGKSTLVKKITSDWVKQQTAIKGLCSYDLLFYAELRDYIDKVPNLFECSLGEEVHHSFKDGDLFKAVSRLRSLVILDGYDELNESSSKLFQEVMSLNKRYSQLTTIVTTRPEAEEKLNTQLKSTTLNAVHLRLVGIKAHKREKFVTKYFLSLQNDSKALRELDKLLEFLRKTGHRMSIVWEVPYNLCLLTILWMFKPDVVNSITTEAELYWQIFLLIISKLEERLLRNPFTSHFPLSLLKNKTNRFVGDLSYESIIALKENNINIPQSTYQRISDLCIKLEVPVEELAGAFLKKIVTLNDSYYSFPHKGYMEFMAAYYIYLQVTKQCINPLESQKSQNSFVAYMRSKITYLRERATRKPTLTKILKRLHGGSLPDSLEKYQNLLIQTLSIFHVGEAEVPEATKIEALELLEKSGLNNRESILKVMHNIKCNDKISRWIAQRFDLFDEDTIIEDSSIESYVALLAATDPPLPNRDGIQIRIRLNDTHTTIEELATQLRGHQVNPRQLFLLGHFKGSSSPNKEETESTKILLTKDCEYYKGIWSPTFQIPPNMKILQVRLQDHPSLDAFCESLEKTKVNISLVIHFSVNDVSRVIRPIPLVEGNPKVYVYVSDVKQEDIEKVGDILRTLQQHDASRTFGSLYFPWCSLRRQEDFIRLLDSLKGVRVGEFIAFPKDKRPDDEALREEMRRRAGDATACEYGTRWRTEDRMFGFLS